jgi:hypothetical protein
MGGVPEVIRYLLALVLSVSAFAAPVTVRVTMPTAYSDGTPLPAANRIGAQLYCGPTAGRYVQGWGALGTDPTVDIVVDISARSFCAVTSFATAPDGTGSRESGYSTEFVINPTVPNIPVTVQTIIQSPAICTTVCIVDRRR